MRGTGSGFLRKSTGANRRKRFSTNTYRKLVLFLQTSPKVSRNLREFTGECNLGIAYSSSLLLSQPHAAVLLIKNPVQSIHKLRIRKLRIVGSEFLETPPIDLGIPSLKSENMFESNTLKSRFLVRGLTMNFTQESGTAS